MLIASDSMRPTYRTGDLVLIESVPAGGLRTGDVAAFRRAPDGPLVIHRVVGTRDVDGRRYLQTKGDANPRADVELLPADGHHSRTRLRLLPGGDLLGHATSRTGRLLLAIIPFAIFVWTLTGLIRTRRRDAAEHVGQGD